MKNNLKFYFVTLFLLGSNFVSFAQLGEDDEGGGLEGDDTPSASIDGDIAYLAIIGILFVFYIYRKNKQRV